MSSDAARPPSTAEQLLEAQVRYHLDRLAGDQLAPTAARLVGDVLAAVGTHPLEDLVDQDTVVDILVREAGTIRRSTLAAGLIDLATTVAYDGPANPYPLGELVDRDRVEVLVDELLTLTPVLERALARLDDSPLVRTMASRFMGRIVNEVWQANKVVADKVPGLGSLMSFGTSAASRVVGAADKQLEGMIGDSVGRGGALAVRRLNRIVIETLNDPTTREAALQIWDLLAQEPVAGLSHYATREELAGVVEAAHELALDTLDAEHVTQIVEVLVAGFFDRFGGRTPTELLDELDLSRDEFVADVVRLAPGVVDALRESGDLERMVRAELEPFYLSAEVADLLGERELS